MIKIFWHAIHWKHCIFITPAILLVFQYKTIEFSIDTILGGFCIVYTKKQWRSK